MTSMTDQIMFAARTLAVIQTERARAIRNYGLDKAPYAEIKRLADRWVEAESALRRLVEQVQHRCDSEECDLSTAADSEGCYYDLHPEPFYEHREGAALGTIY